VREIESKTNIKSLSSGGPHHKHLNLWVRAVRILSTYKLNLMLYTAQDVILSIVIQSFILNTLFGHSRRV